MTQEAIKHVGDNEIKDKEISPKVYKIRTHNMHRLEPKVRFFHKIKPEKLSHYELFLECKYFEVDPEKINKNHFKKTTSLKWKSLKKHAQTIPSQSCLLEKLLLKIQQDESTVEKVNAKNATEARRNFFCKNQRKVPPKVDSYDLWTVPKTTAMSEILPKLTLNMSLNNDSDDMNDQENQPPITQSTSKSKSSKKSTQSSKPKKQRKRRTEPQLMEDQVSLRHLQPAIDRYNSNDSEGGTLIQVRLIDFMSHKNFVFPSTKEELKSISFICGPNGSGKSAILMAMKLLFGAKGRLGNNLAYIREGMETAVISCILQNDCPNPYEPELYGPKIEIRVTISKKEEAKTGKQTAQVVYNTKSHTGRKVAASKQAILAIAEHYNIMIDNPITILDQDFAKKFLKELNPLKLYNFFEKTTAIEDLERGLHKSRVEIKEIKNTISSLKEEKVNATNKQKEWNEWKKVVEAANVDANQIDDLNLEIIWANADVAEGPVNEARKKVEKNSKKLVTDEMKLDEDKNISQNLAGKIVFNKKELNEANLDLDRVQAELDEVNEQFDVMNASNAEYNRGYQGLAKTLKATQAKVKEREAQFAREKKRIENDQTEIKIKETEEKRLEIERTIETADAKIRALQQELTMKQSELDERVSLCQTSKSELGKANSSVRELSKTVERLRGGGDKIDQIYGNGTKSLVDMINSDRHKSHFKHVPIGPIGNFIKLKEEYFDQDWAAALEKKALKPGFLRGWIVSGTADANMLRKCSQKLGYHLGSIYTWADFSGPMVAPTDSRARRAVLPEGLSNSSQFPGIVNAFDTLQITNKVVNNLVLQQSTNANRLVLIKDPKKAAEFTKSKFMHQSIQFVLTIDGQEYYANKNYRGFGKSKAEILVKDMDQLREQYQNDLIEAENVQRIKKSDHQQAEQELNAVKKGLSETKSKENQYNKQLTGNEKNLRHLDGQIQTLISNRPDQHRLNVCRDEITSKQLEVESLALELKQKDVEFNILNEEAHKFEKETLKPKMVEHKKIKTLSQKCTENVKDMINEKNELERSVTKKTKDLVVTKQNHKVMSDHLDQVSKVWECKVRLATASGDRPGKVRDLKKVQKVLNTLLEKKRQAMEELGDITETMITTQLNVWAEKYSAFKFKIWDDKKVDNFIKLII